MVPIVLVIVLAVIVLATVEITDVIGCVLSDVVSHIELFCVDIRGTLLFVVESPMIEIDGARS